MIYHVVCDDVDELICKKISCALPLSDPRGRAPHAGFFRAPRMIFRWPNRLIVSKVRHLEAPKRFIWDNDHLAGDFALPDVGGVDCLCLHRLGFV